MNLNLSKIKLEVKGKNINRFIKKLHKNKINLLNLKYLEKDKIEIIIYDKDLKKINKLKTIYKIKIINIYGLKKVKRTLKLNKIIFIYLMIVYLIFLLLTNTIFKVEILASNKETRKLIKEELNKYNLKKFTIKKNKDELEKIKDKILLENKDKLEWLSIENIGTKYIIKSERRIIPKLNTNNNPRDIISKKNAIIKKIYNISGETIKEENTYVNKGETIISNEIKLNDEVKEKVRARGKVYGEVWYKISSSCPLTYTQNKYLDKKYKISFLRKNKTYILKNDLIPLYLIKTRKIKKKTYLLTYDEAINKAKENALNKMKKRLKKGEHIITYKYLKSTPNESTIDVEMFFSIYEDITDYR